MILQGRSHGHGLGCNNVDILLRKHDGKLIVNLALHLPQCKDSSFLL